MSIVSLTYYKDAIQKKQKNVSDIIYVRPPVDRKREPIKMRE